MLTRLYTKIQTSLIFCDIMVSVEIPDDIGNRLVRNDAHASFPAGPSAVNMSDVIADSLRR